MVGVAGAADERSAVEDVADTRAARHSPTGRRRPMDWAALETEYITTSVSLRALAEKYKISEFKLKKRSKVEGWVGKRNQYRAKSVQKTIERTSDLTAEANAILYEAAKSWAETLMSYTKQEVEDLKWKPKDITGPLKDCFDILNNKSDLDIEEQRARIDKLRKEAQTEEQTREVRVRIEGAGDGWES